MALFLKVLFMIFIAELGDKSQFLMIAMASQYKIRDIITGVFTSVFALNVIAIAIGSVVGGALPMTPINIAAGLVFLCFALTAAGGDGEEGEDIRDAKCARGAVFAIFGTFFIAEIGDKTQVAVIALAADGNHGGFSITNTLLILAGATLGLFAADVLGLLCGFFLGKKLPYRLFAGISCAIFAVFGVITLLDGFSGLFAGSDFQRLYSIIATAGVATVFASATLLRFLARRRKEGVNE